MKWVVEVEYGGCKGEFLLLLMSQNHGDKYTIVWREKLMKKSLKIRPWSQHRVTLVPVLHYFSICEDKFQDNAMLHCTRGPFFKMGLQMALTFHNVSLYRVSGLWLSCEQLLTSELWISAAPSVSFGYNTTKCGVENIVKHKLVKLTLTFNNTAKTTQWFEKTHVNNVSSGSKLSIYKGYLQGILF